MSAWAEANYILSAETSDIPGPWSNDYTPFLAPIMDRWSDVRRHPPLLKPRDNFLLTKELSLFIVSNLTRYEPPTFGFFKPRSQV